MGTILLKRILMVLLACSINSFSIYAFAADAISDLEKRVKHDPSSSQVVYASQILSDKRLGKIKLKSSHLVKAEYLYQTAKNQGLFTEDELFKSDFVDLVRAVSYIRSKQKRRLFWSSKYTNTYVHPSDGITKIPIQFYENKHVYIHFKNFDRNKKFGGYKTFSRSIDFDSGKVFASLVAPILREKDKTAFLRELSIQLALSGLSHVLSFRDVGLYQGYRKGKLLHKVTFQTELYEADLSRLYTNSVPVESMADIMLQASRAIFQMHQMGYIHRDIKPANFFVRKARGQIQLVIADFGLSQLASGPGFGKHLAGTRGYMDPNISLNHVEKKWTCKSFEECQLADIYSLGISFYSLIKGRNNNLKQITNKINHIALPKNKQNPPSTQWIYQYIKELDEAYLIAAQSLSASEGLDNEGLWSLEKLAWSRVNPDPQKRPSLRVLIDSLEQINAGLRADAA